MCTYLSDALIRLGKGDESQAKRITEFIILLVRVLDMLSSEDRHKTVIT